MPNRNKIVPTLALLVGTVFAIAGVLGIGFYILSVVDALGQADKSAIFWFSIFFFAGIGLLTAGVFFCVHGVKAGKGSTADYVQAKNMLFIVLAVLVLLAAGLLI